MAARLDVAARLDEGREAVRRIQCYVSACRILGYQHPDLTVYDGQLADCYDGEAGLDLRTLDEDCGRLRTALAAAEEALRMQRGQIGELTAAWRGAAAERAVGFLQRHCDSAAAVAAVVRADAEQCATLIDVLWQLIDEKVAAVVDIDDRVGASRDEWLAAARTVTVGCGDRGTAAEIVEQQITPYVDTDIRTDWLTVMHSTRRAVAAAYAGATAGWIATARFEIPGEFGARYQSAATAVSVPVAPLTAHRESAAVEPPSALAAAPETPVDAPLPIAAPEPAVGAVPAGSPTDPGSPTSTGDLSGLLRQFVDAIDGLRDVPEDGLDDDGFDETPADKEPGGEELRETDGEPGSEVEPATDAQPESAVEPAPDAQPASAAGAQGAPPADTAQPADVAAEPTACEIAADELPQVGE